MAIKYESPKNDAGRVTAGIPSLDSSRRFTLDSRKAQTAYSDALVAEVQGKAIASAAGDGDKPHDLDHAGLWLTGYELEKRIRALNPNLIFERSIYFPSAVGIYVHDPSSQSERKIRKVAAFEYERCAEFDLVRIARKVVRDRNGVKQYYNECVGDASSIISLPRIPGWRSVLASLVKEKLITESGVSRMFGAPSRDSKNWQSAINATK